jgi:uncharacterized protein YbaP (TraB family)
MNRNIHKIIAGLMSLLLLSFIPCFGQISKTPTFCWMVLSKKTQTPSFIFGTIHHLGPKPVLDNKELMRIIMRCKLIVQEADTTELLHSTHPGFDFTSDTALDELLGYSDYQYVKYEFFKATGKDIEQYKFRMPQAIMLMIEKGKKDKEIYKSKMPLMENAFYALSVVKKIPIKGLETRQDIFNIMYKGMPLQDQAKLLLHSLKDHSFNRSEETMNACFEKQDLSCFCKVDDMNHYTAPGDSTIILKRNLFWIKNIRNYIEQGNVFIAVGAAHLCGNFGIISLLKKDGYTIVPVMTK